MDKNSFAFYAIIPVNFDKSKNEPKNPPVFSFIDYIALYYYLNYYNISNYESTTTLLS